MRKLKLTALLLLVLALLAPAVPVGAFALSGSDPMLFADLSRADFQFGYTPTANGDYSLYIFSAEGGDVQAEAILLEEGEVIASGSGSGEVLHMWLSAGTRYTLRVHGSGNAMIEIARNTLSRCYQNPLQAEENRTSEKMIAHDYDAHWYRFQAQADNLLFLTCVPEDSSLALSAMLFDDTGALVARFEELSGGAAMLKAATQTGRSYSIRISAPGGGTGYYALNLHRPEESGITAVRFPSANFTLSAGGELNLDPYLQGKALLWVSDSPDVAAAQQDGTIIGLVPGTARITAYGMHSQATCLVRVKYVPLDQVEIMAETIRLSVGDDADVPVYFTPQDASDRRLRYRIADPSIASVTPDGVLKALQPGETTLTVVSITGGVMDGVQVEVSPAVRKYRALLVSEENYPFSEDERRNGSNNSADAIASLLETAEFDNAAFVTRTRYDLSKAELIAEIRSHFRGATPLDVSLLYITCHGSYSGGMSFLELSDGSSISARDLERELRSIPGTVVVLIDCCGSGGAIGAASERIAFAKGITGAFSGASIRGSKYKVLASAGLDEDSFRIAFNENAASGVMATAFARALCDGAGWDIDRNARGTMGADQNYDGSITLAELWQYMSDRVNWYLDIASDLTGDEYRQSVQVYPEGDPFVVIQR